MSMSFGELDSTGRETRPRASTCMNDVAKTSLSEPSSSDHDAEMGLEGEEVFQAMEGHV